MAERIDEQNIHERLSAFADGELDAAQMAQVLDYLSDHRGALDELRAQQKLRTRAATILKNQVPPPGEDLVARIRQIAEAARPAEQKRLTVHGPARTRMQWAAAAALLLGGVAAGRWAYLVGPAKIPAVISEPAPVVAVELIAHALAIHADCSRLAAGLHAAGYPDELGDLANDVRRDIASDEPYPDLSSIGFIYRGAGPCGAPIPNTIHLLYKSRERASTHAVSVFVQVNSGQFKLDAGKLYSLSDARSPFPMLAWRTDRVVYFLIADDRITINKAQALIAPAAKPIAPPPQ